MIRLLAAACMLGVLAAPARAAETATDGMIAVKSPTSTTQTLDRLQKLVTDAGFFVAARVPHSQAAKKVGLTLRPTELLIFGKPQGGTPIMACNQKAGIDLPLRALAWQDEQGQVWLGMVDPRALKARYDLGPECDKPLAAMTAATRKFLEGATAS